MDLWQPRQAPPSLLPKDTLGVSTALVGGEHGLCVRLGLCSHSSPLTLKETKTGEKAALSRVCREADARPPFGGSLRPVPPQPPPATPELLQRPVVGGPVLLVLHLHSHNGAGEGPRLSVFGSLWGQQVRWQWGVECVREEDKLELDLRQAPDVHPSAPCWAGARAPRASFPPKSMAACGDLPARLRRGATPDHLITWVGSPPPSSSHPPGAQVRQHLSTIPRSRGAQSWV